MEKHREAKLAGATDLQGSPLVGLIPIATEVNAELLSPVWMAWGALGRVRTATRAIHVVLLVRPYKFNFLVSFSEACPLSSEDRQYSVRLSHA